MNKTVDRYTTYVITRDGKYLCGDGVDEWTDDLTHPKLYTNKVKEDIAHIIAEYWDERDWEKKKNRPGKLRNATFSQIYIITTKEIFKVL